MLLALKFLCHEWMFTWEYKDLNTCVCASFDGAFAFPTLHAPSSKPGDENGILMSHRWDLPGGELLDSKIFFWELGGRIPEELRNSVSTEGIFPVSDFTFAQGPIPSPELPHKHFMFLKWVMWKKCVIILRFLPADSVGKSETPSRGIHLLCLNRLCFQPLLNHSHLYQTCVWLCFGCFLKSGTKLKKLQARVLGMLSQCPANLLDPLISIYQLQTADRNYLLEHVSHLYLQGNYKEVGHVFQINLPCQLSVNVCVLSFGCISMWIPFHPSSCMLWMLQLSVLFPCTGAAWAQPWLFCWLRTECQGILLHSFADLWK